MLVPASRAVMLLDGAADAVKEVRELLEGVPFKTTSISEDELVALVMKIHHEARAQEKQP